MKSSNFRRTRYYRVSAAEYPIEKYLLSTGFQEAAEEYAALFDLGELFDEVKVTVSLCGAVGDWSVRTFRVGSTQIRVYGAEPLEEPRAVDSDEFDEFDEFSDAELLEWEDLTGDTEPGEEDDEELTVVRFTPEPAESDSSTEMELSDNQSSGLRRLAGNLVRLFGRRRTRREAA